MPADLDELEPLEPEADAPALPREAVRVCVIDMGTNSFHALVVEVEPDGRLRSLDTRKEMVLLGQGGMVAQRLTDDAMERGLAALRRIRLLGTHWHVETFVAAATSAVREATNGPAFVARVKREVGIDVETISGDTEARMIHRAVWQTVRHRPPALLVDVGGGSTEFIVAVERTTPFLVSLPLGAQRLTEQFVHDDPLTTDGRRALKAHLRTLLAPVTKAAERYGVRRVVGSSGTLRTLAELVLGDDARAVFERELPTAQVREGLRPLIRSDRAARRLLAPLSEKRLDQIVAGAVLLDVVLADLNPDFLQISPYALREGLALAYAERRWARPLRLTGLKNAGRSAD